MKNHPEVQAKEGETALPIAQTKVEEDRKVGDGSKQDNNLSVVIDGDADQSEEASSESEVSSEGEASSEGKGRRGHQRSHVFFDGSFGVSHFERRSNISDEQKEELRKKNEELTKIFERIMGEAVAEYSKVHDPVPSQRTVSMEISEYKDEKPSEHTLSREGLVASYTMIWHSRQKGNTSPSTNTKEKIAYDAITEAAGTKRTALNKLAEGEKPAVNEVAYELLKLVIANLYYQKHIQAFKIKAADEGSDDDGTGVFGDVLYLINENFKNYIDKNRDEILLKLKPTHDIHKHRIFYNAVVKFTKTEHLQQFVSANAPIGYKIQSPK